MAINQTNSPNNMGGSSVSASTQLSDSANLARLNAANSFTTGPQTIAPLTAVQALRVTAATGYGGFVVQVDQNGTNLFLINTSNGEVHGYTLVSDVSMYINGQGILGYKGVNVVGMGIPAIYASGRQEGVSAAAASSIATFTPASDGTFLVSGNVLVTTAGTIAATMTCTYTDEGNTSRTATLPFTLIAGAPLTAIAFANGNVPYEGLPLRIRAKAGTAITIQTAGTFTGSVYNCEADIIQVK